MLNRKGFTLVELILVIAILGILAISALPRFLDMSTEARQASRDGVIGAVRAGIALYHANDMVTTGSKTGNYPDLLDKASDGACSDANLCFTTVLANGVDDVNWVKTSQKTYTYNDGTTVTTYTYNAENGTFQ